ncbi:hypothetical protein RvY_08322 [Ramazzottius varieornatus]|uniref:Uncharacterized protein n=1 Tax=Ramazzottius varieornatus TaxID=947166 RepID=A0A1D1VEM6_RAMVA|nr:hypothetical protein RvY_08322 [Ramazzottius varieornatus]
MAKTGGVDVQELKRFVETTLEERQQIAIFEEDDSDERNSHAVQARHVELQYPDQSNDDGISRQHSHYVSTKPCIEYKWEQSFYHGRLIAVHMSGHILAYTLQTHHSGKVRVTTEEASKDGRCLLKDFSTQLADIDFAHVPDAYYIACMEQDGWCTVFAIHDVKPMKYELIVKIRISAGITKEITEAGLPCRAIWCVHVPEQGAKPSFLDSGDVSNCLALTCGGKAVVVSVPRMQEAAGAENQPITVEEMETKKGLAIMKAGANIWDGKMSPDGVVLCLAREDGCVHFYQCVLRKGESSEEEYAPLVYTWTPHDGRPVHSLNFFDDFTSNSKQEQFWMFAVSGCEYGRQFKIWNCQHWYCLQTIDVLASVDRPLESVKLQVTVDPTGQYLILADTQKNRLMFLRVDKDLKKRVAIVSSVNEFVVGSPILNVVAVSLRSIRPGEDNRDSPRLDHGDNNENGFEAQLMTLHSHLFQHMNVTYIGEQLPSKDRSSSLSSETRQEANVAIKSSFSKVEDSLQASNTSAKIKNEPSFSALNGSVESEKEKPKKERKKKRENAKNVETFSSGAEYERPDWVTTSEEGHESMLEDLVSKKNVSTELGSTFDVIRPLVKDVSETDFSSIMDEFQVLNDGRKGETRQESVSQPRDNGQSFAADSLDSIATSTAKLSLDSPADVMEKIKTQNKQEEVVFGAPPVNEGVSATATMLSVSSVASLESVLVARENFHTAENSFVSENETPSSTSETDKQRQRQSFETLLPPQLLQGSMNSVSNDRLEQMENTLKTIVSALQHQTQMVQRLAATVETLKAQPVHNGHSSVPTESSEVVSRKNAEMVSKSLLVPIQQMETRMANSLQGLAPMIEAAVARELTKQLGLSLRNALKLLTEKLATDVFMRLNTVEATLCQKVAESLRSPQFNQTLSASVSAQLGEVVKLAVSSVVAGQLVNSINQIMNQAIGSINQVFNQGTKDYLAQINRSLEGYFVRMDGVVEQGFKGMDESNGKAYKAGLKQVSSELSQKVEGIVERNIEGLYGQLMQNLGGQISQKVTSFVREEMREQQGVLHDSMVQMLRSGVATPGGAVLGSQQKIQSLMQEIKAALDKQDVNNAFRLALSASDLGAVLYVCEKVNVHELFMRPDSLQTPVLFSLIQQLAADIGCKTELKIQYLEEALMAVRSDDLEASSFKYLKTVLTEVVSKLQKFLRENPQHAAYRTVRLLANNANLHLSQISRQSGKATDGAF